jgi:hypothetical protein
MTKRFGAAIWLEIPNRPVNRARDTWTRWYTTERDRDTAVAAINRRPSTDRGSAYRAAPLASPAALAPTADELETPA